MNLGTKETIGKILDAELFFFQSPLRFSEYVSCQSSDAADPVFSCC